MSLFRLLTLRSRAHLTSSLYSSLILSLLFYSRSYHPRRYALAPVSASCFCFSYLVPSTLFLTCSASLACMYTLHACSASCFHYRTCFPTVHVHFSSRASWLHALTSYHTLHFILYLYSVLLGRASSAVVLQRLPNIHCLLFCSAPTLQLSRTGYESESPTNSGVIEDTGNSTCAVYLWRI